MTRLDEQLTNIFSAGLESQPELRASLAEALNSFPQHDNTVTKSEANYRLSETKENCGNCTYFSDNKCEIVVGRISSDHISDYYKEA